MPCEDQQPPGFLISTCLSHTNVGVGKREMRAKSPGVEMRVKDE